MSGHAVFRCWGHGRERGSMWFPTLTFWSEGAKGPWHRPLTPAVVHTECTAPSLLSTPDVRFQTKIQLPAFCAPDASLGRSRQGHFWSTKVRE